jgi:hypothetical protein
LIDFVGSEHFSAEVPCHFIALNEAGETIEDLEAEGNQAKLETTLKQWMRSKIKQARIAEQRSDQTSTRALVQRTIKEMPHDQDSAI